MRKIFGTLALLTPLLAAAQTTVAPDPETDGATWPHGTWLFMILVAVLFWAFFAQSGIFYHWAKDRPVLAWVALFAVPATACFLLT